MRIALAGNPNSGKTTMFNALTGLRGICHAVLCSMIGHAWTHNLSAIQI